MSMEETIEQAINEMNLRTHEAMMNPQVGDRFQEMYSFWMYVIKVTKRMVWTISASAPCTFPEDGKIERRTREAFAEHYSYKHSGLKNKYWVSLVDRNNDVKGWMGSSCTKK